MIRIACGALALAVLCETALGQQFPGTIDGPLIRDTVEAVATVVAREYFAVDVGASVAATLRQRLGEGRYGNATTPVVLAGLLTRDRFETTKDKHLAVTVVDVRASSPTQPAADSAREVVIRRANYGIQRVEVLPGNVGYLNLTAFYRIEEARGYFFDDSAMPLFEIVWKSSGRQQFTTERQPVPERDGAKPLWVLTASRTFSGGEGFAFILQERRRALVIGEVTAGAANPGRSYPVNSRFEVTVPNGQVRTAVSGRNWEGSGVTPDVSVPADAALREAHIRALRELIGRTAAGAWRDTLTRTLDGLDRARQ